MNDQQQAERTLYERAGELIRGVEECGATCPVHQTGYELAIYFRRINDPTPITEEFARSVAVDVTTAGSGFLAFRVGLGERCGDVRLMRAPSGLWRMFCGSGTIDNPTIGDFYTACRLFKVQLKEGASNGSVS